jgi:uncharacterized damage-inducible protein DinB
MNLADIKELFAYNRWAHARIFDAVAQITPEQYAQDLKSSHGGIQGTLVHTVGAEKIWLARWKNEQNPTFLKVTDVPTLAELRALFERVDGERDRLLGSFTDETIHGTFIIKRADGATLTSSFAQAMQHLVNHATYHRGQVITMLRQIGAKAVSTDLILYYREKSGKA